MNDSNKIKAGMGSNNGQKLMNSLGQGQIGSVQGESVPNANGMVNQNDKPSDAGKDASAGAQPDSEADQNPGLTGKLQLMEMKKRQGTSNNLYGQGGKVNAIKNNLKNLIWVTLALLGSPCTIARSMRDWAFLRWSIPLCYIN